MEVAMELVIVGYSEIKEWHSLVLMDFTWLNLALDKDKEHWIGHDQ